jgi:hypothetical protein
MADKVTPGPLTAGSAQNPRNIKESVCVHTRKVYDSCKDKDCIEDLRVYLDASSQCYISNAIGVRARSAELLFVGIDVDEVAFNRGYYTIDCRFFYKVKGEAYSLSNRSNEIGGLAVFDKRVLLFGSEGNAKIFSSTFGSNCEGIQNLAKTNLPIAVVEAVDPIILNMKLVDTCDCNPCDNDCFEIPPFITSVFTDNLVLSGEPRRVYCTRGQFSIVKLERDSQLLIPVYDYCVPEKECIGSNDSDPCDLFKRIKFPVDEFFPPDTVCND